MLRFLRWAALRSLYPLLVLAAVWGHLAWGRLAWAGLPVGVWLGLPLALLALHLVPYAEARSGPTPPDLVTVPPPLAQRLARWLSHPEDVHGVVFCAVHFAALGSAFWLWLHPGVTGFDTPAEKLGFALGAGLWLGWSGGVNLGVNYHSHAHKPFFRHDLANRWFGRLICLPGAMPAYWWRYKHLAVHHGHLGEERDWVQPKRRADGRYENLWLYVLLYWPWRWGVHFWREFRHEARPAVRRRAWREAALFAVLWSLPFFADPWLGLGLWLFPAWVGSSVVMGMGMYAQHAGGTADDRYSHTTTFLSHWGNLTMFNAGFHVEHHEHPSVHWSELPRLHAAMRDELIAGGAHVVPFGLYRGSALLNSWFRQEEGWRRFGEQHPDYRRAEVATEPSAAMPSAADAAG